MEVIVISSSEEEVSPPKKATIASKRPMSALDADTEKTAPNKKLI